MFAVSARFLSTIQKSHAMVASCVVKDTNGNQLLPTAALPVTVEAQGSKVTVDRSQAYRRTCNLMLSDPSGSLTPGVATDILGTASGNELWLYRGIDYQDGTQELVPLGVFWIGTTKVDDSAGKLTITIAGYDRGLRVARHRLADYYSVAGATAVESAIAALIDQQASGLPKNFAVTGYSLPAQVLNPNSDPWQSAQAWAAAAGCALFPDVNGVLTLAPVPDPTTGAAVVTYTEGSQAVITDYERSMTNVDIPNHVIRDGAGTGVGAAVRGEAKDTNQESPTWINGPFGDIVDYAQDSSLLTQAQAQAAAQAVLNAKIGSMEGLQLNQIVNAALDIDDVIQVSRARLKLASTFFVVDRVEVPLGRSDVQTLVTRRVARLV